jgi:nucleotide-binding universal stress UspA family protein
VAPRLPKGRQAEGRGKGYEKRVLREITQILERAKKKVASNHTAIDLLTEIGSPSAAIVRRAEDYDLTVIGPKGRGTTGEVGLGPVASRVVEHARGPILVARELRSEEGLRVLVAVDGSTAAFHATETLGQVCNLGAAEVCLMHVAETPWTEFGLEEDWVTYSEEDKRHSDAGMLEHEMLREGEALLEQARDLLRPYEVSVTTRIDEGNPTNEILSEAERGQYDLIVVGATGARDLKHQMLGSVSSKIAWNAPCSVLIVREPE